MKVKNGITSDARGVDAETLQARIAELERWFHLQEQQIQALEKERKKFSAIVNHTDAGFLVVNSLLDVEWVNSVFAQRFNFCLRDESYRHKRCNEVLCGRDTICDSCFVAHTIQNGEVAHHEFRVDTGGEKRHVYATAMPIKTHEGVTEEAIVMLQDITDLQVLRQSQNELKSSEEVFRSLSASSPIAIFKTDDQGLVEYTNPRWEELSGLTVEESVGLGWTKAVHPDDIEQEVGAWREAFSQAKVHSNVLRIRRPDGEIRWVHVRAAPLTVESDRVSGYVGTIEDITETKQYEDTLRTAKEVAEAASIAKSEFLANMSHEIRTPMNGVIGMTNLLLDTELDKDQYRMANNVLKSADSLLTIINEILDYSKIEAGKLTLDPIPFNLRETVDDVVVLFAGQAQEKGIEIDIDYSDGAPQRVVGDQVRIRQILANLVSNAVKFTHDGQVRVSVEQVFRDEAGVLLRLAVADTGIGIPGDKIDRIFDKFTQADTTTTRKYGGTGLGLAICTQLVELMKGSINARSKLGHGTIFEVTLNLPVENRSENEAGRADSDDVSAPAPLDARVLVVEDNIVNQELAAALLRKMGCTVDVANDGIAAVAMSAIHQYDVIFMDCQMPEMDGYEATHAIRTRERLDDRHTPIIALTANAMSGDRDKCTEAGMDDYVTKPIQNDDLRGAVERFVGKGMPPKG